MDRQEALASDAYVRGRRDANNGFSLAANPFPTGSSESEQYRQGHYSATFTVDARCIAPGHGCPLRTGECSGGCYLQHFEREAA